MTYNMMASQGIAGKKIAVLGANPSGRELCKFLCQKGAHTTLISYKNMEDLQTWAQEELKSLSVHLVEGAITPGALEGQQVIIYTSDISYDPKIFEYARNLGITVFSELEFVSLYTTAPVIAISGSNGKSSTAYLLENFFSAQGKKCFSNAEQPLASLLNLLEPVDFCLALCTPFQVQGIRSFTPSHIAFLNLAADHTDHYPNFETYLCAQREIFRNVSTQTTLILNALDQNIISFVQGLPGRNIFFGNQEVPAGFEGMWVRRKKLFIRLRDFNKPHEISLEKFRLRGTHNAENLMAAAALALLNGVSLENIQSVIEEVKVPRFRLKFVKRVNEVAFYNDSCATNPYAVMRSLTSFNEPIILIMGGADHEIEFLGLAPHVRQRVKNLILLGESKEKINRALGDHTETFLVGTLEEAILISYQKSRSGEVVLYSPGCPAESLFRDEYDRGNIYSKTVQSLARPRKPNVI